jgi:hypothetical protein
MSNNKKPIVHLRIFKGQEMLYDGAGNLKTPSQIVKLTHDTVEWKNFVNNLAASGYGMAKVEKVLQETSAGEYKEIEASESILKEVENIFKTPEKELTPEQKEIAELKAIVAGLTKGNKATKGIDLLADLKKEYESMTDAIPNPDWGVQEYQDIITEMKKASK